MRIGILTHHYVNNFGAYLQAYCLLSAIRQLRPMDTVEMIDFVLPKHKLINTGGMCRFYPKRESLAAWFAKLSLVGTFHKAQKALPLTRRVYSAAQINELGLDVIVVGSDEVWNYTDVRSFSPVKFGVGLQGSRLVAYSPSVGIVDDFSGMDEKLVKGLDSFASLSARDDLTEKMLQTKVGKAYTRTLDPVLIHPLPSAMTPRIEKLIKKPYALMYHFGLPYEQQKAKLYPALRAKGLTILGAGEYNQGYDQLSVDITPFEMAELFHHAQYVFTGTFHGVVLSYVYHKPFLVCPNNPTRARKLGSLLTEMGLTAQMTSPDGFDFETAWALKPDYDQLEALLAPKREQSLRYLSGALSEEV